MKKNLINFISKSQNNVIEPFHESVHGNVLERSSTIDNEILSVKNILKIGTPLPLEPSLYSPIHILGVEKTN